MNTLNILNEIAADSSKLAKEAILRREQNNDLLKRVFKAAYDPTINFWIKKIPTTESVAKISLSEAINELQYLADRTYTGQEGIDHLTAILRDVSPDDATVISRIVDRDLRIGCGGSTANKVWKKLIPEFTYMRCSLPTQVKLEKWDWTGGVYSQTKADAMFANMDVYSGGDVVITSRNGTVIPNTHLGNVVDAAKKMLTEGFRVHGELMVEEGGKYLPREIANGIMNSIAKGGSFKNKNQRAVYVVWDQIPISNAMSGEEYKKTYTTRFSSLQVQLANLGVQDSIRVIGTKIVKSYKEALEHYQEMLEDGQEGTVIKEQTGTWKDTTSKSQVKMKLEADVDLEIISLKAGNGKNADLFGSVICRTSDGLLEVAVSGFSDEKRQYIFDNFKTIKGKIMAVRGNNLMAPTGNKTTWSMFLPRCVEIRDDKTTADSLQQVKDQFDSLIGK